MKPRGLVGARIYCGFSCVLNAAVIIVFDATVSGTTLGVVSRLITNNINGEVVPESK
jgi:hypothetical protein